MWSKYPEAKPDESGYYFTKYFNPEQQEVFWKAIWYCTKRSAWIPWRPGVDGLEVYDFVAESRHEYYVPCQMWGEEKHQAGELQFI